MDFIRLAAIDIGSNAIRLLITNVIESDGELLFKKASLIRAPLRLGDDAFERGIISPEKEEKLMHLMQAYRHLMIVNDVVGYRACATSAMRDAVNGPALVKRIKDISNINIEIIDGKEEAKIIYDSHIADMLDHDSNYIYIDVGGGSTEMTVLINGEMVTSRSFNIGTLRILNKSVEKHSWDQMHEWIQEVLQKYGPVEIIGSGGNINKLYKIAGIKAGQPMSRVKLMAVAKHLTELTVEERMIQYSLNPDRADVIVPACEIFLIASKWIGARHIFVPVIGVADGITKELYTNLMNGIPINNVLKP